MTKTAITFHPLDDGALMAVAGRVTVRHSHLDYQLKMTIRMLTGVTPDQARKAHKRTGSAELRKLVLKHGERALGISADLIRLQALMAECEAATEQRNDYVHVIWAREFSDEGKGHLFDSDGSLRPLPTTADLDKLDGEIGRLIKAVGEAKDGYLQSAIKAKP